MMNEDAVEILLVEDNPADVDLVRAVLAESFVSHHVSTASDGADALAFLRKQGAHAGAPTPGLVILDLNLPKKDGREVLADLKRDPDLGRIPVVVLTSSDRDQDVADVYRLHASCFVRKPIDLDDYWATVRDIERFWLGRARLPHVTG